MLFVLSVNDTTNLFSIINRKTATEPFLALFKESAAFEAIASLTLGCYK